MALQESSLVATRPLSSRFAEGHASSFSVCSRAATDGRNTSGSFRSDEPRTRGSLVAPAPVFSGYTIDQTGQIERATQSPCSFKVPHAKDSRSSARILIIDQETIFYRHNSDHLRQVDVARATTCAGGADNPTGERVHRHQNRRPLGSCAAVCFGAALGEG